MQYTFEFFKYQGCGNDFVIIDEMKGPVTSDSDRSKLSRILCDRHFGIGADGIFFVEKAKDADGSMRLFEQDGGEADMCGNGIRCVASYLSGKLQKSDMDILTRDGVKHVSRLGNEYRVQMGPVRTQRRNLSRYITDEGNDSDMLLDLQVNVRDKIMTGSLVNTGEPHLVFRSENVKTVDIKNIAEEINRDRKRFPHGMNVNFMQIIGPHEISNRTYERGVYDETMACGTGATASAAVSLLLRLVKSGPVKVNARGGNITIEIDGQGNAQMTGPANEVFEGKLTIDI
jgi:diaminopimelate epimerase